MIRHLVAAALGALIGVCVVYSAVRADEPKPRHASWMAVVVTLYAGADGPIMESVPIARTEAACEAYRNLAREQAKANPDKVIWHKSWCLGYTAPSPRPEIGRPDPRSPGGSDT